MSATTVLRSTPKLSICISTLNRADFIGTTLESIVPQLTGDCELLVLDNASSDGTEQIVSSYARRTDRLRYVRKRTDDGFDRNFDQAVELAQGEYCWLMSDDDWLKPGAVRTVLDALNEDLSLLVVDLEIMDFSMSKVLQSRWIGFQTDRIYAVGETDRLFLDLSLPLMYIGAIIIKRTLWMERDRASYYGSTFVHTAVIFQKQLPGTVRFMAQPLISYRMSNRHEFSSIDIVLARWPSFVQSLPLAESLKDTSAARPWKNLRKMLFWRAYGFYTLSEYRRLLRDRLRPREKVIPILVALFPGALANAMFVLYYSILHRAGSTPNSGTMLEYMKESRFYVLRRWKKPDDRYPLSARTEDRGG